MELVLTGAAQYAGEFRTGVLLPSAESNPHVRLAQNIMHIECCQNFETVVTTSQPKNHFRYGDRIAILTVFVNAFRITSVTLKSPLIDSSSGSLTVTAVNHG